MNIFGALLFYSATVQESPRLHQAFSVMRYEPIDNSLFKKNRANLQALLKPQSIAVFHSADIMPTSADGVMKFKQHSDIFYLSGIDQEESILLVCTDTHNKKLAEILFLRETNEEIAVWEGEKLTKAQAQQLSGVDAVYWLQDFEKVWKELVFEAQHLYLNTNEHLRNSSLVETPDDRFRKTCMAQYPLHKYERVSPLMHRLRAVKSEQEIAQLRTACEITEKGFRRILPFVKPNVWEYEIEAELIHEFIRNRATGFAYSPIVASGANACILHYIENNRICKDGDLLLLDIGAEYANYNADLTRCIPVNGRFSPRQKQVYQAVWRVMEEAKKLLCVGNNWIDYHKEVGKIMESELIDLGLLAKHEVAKQDPNKPLYKKYFPHGTSHHLGLNVHDYGNKYHQFEAGMVFTCEPGIYIQAEGIGIRLENDIVIGNSKNEDLMATIPLAIEEIEQLMNK
jgi:Xaa-Pro aminopeptidase